MIKLILLPILGIIGAFIYIKKRNQVITELKALLKRNDLNFFFMDFMF